MAEIPEFEVPSFLDDQGTNKIHTDMLNSLPDTWDKSEGGFVWDLTRPVALEKAKFVQFNLIELMKNIFPMWAYGEILDYHAFTRNINRKSAVSATVELKITGTPGTEIKAGYEVATEAENNTASIKFKTLEDTVIPAAEEEKTDGVVVVMASAANAGKSGNVAAGTIKLQVTPLKGVSKVINDVAATGGADQEDNESLRQRIVDYDRSLGVSFVGSDSDYKRWAEEVPGVGSATIIPAQDDTGLVTIVLVDPDGKPATEDLCAEVYNYIMREDDRQQRQAPINAQLNVRPPETKSITIEATIKIEAEYSLDGVKASFMKRLIEYLMRCPEDGEVRYHEIGKLLLTDGIIDYSGLKVKSSDKNDPEDGVSNIPLKTGVLPITDDNMVNLKLDTSSEGMLE